MEVVVVDVVVVDVVVLVDEVVVVVLPLPEHAARGINNPAIMNTFFDILLISLRCSIGQFQTLMFHGLTTQCLQLNR